MVLNFFQLRDHTAFTFNLINSENPDNNYDVGPWVTSARGDMWLAQDNGEKGVSILTFSDGSASRNLLYMWDHGSALRYRIGDEAQSHAISVNGNKDFSIDVYNTALTFVCYNGSFNSSGQSTVTIDDWKDYLSNHFGELYTSSLELLRYVREFGEETQNIDLRSEQQLEQHELRREKRGIELPSEAQRRAVTNLVVMWEDDYLEHGRGQGTLYADREGWRIDLQDNGAVVRNGMHFYNIAVQYTGGRGNGFAHTMLPVGYVIGRRRIRNAILNSMSTSQVTVIVPPHDGLAFVRGIPYTSDRARNSWAIQSLKWVCTDASALAWI